MNYTRSLLFALPLLLGLATSSGATDQKISARTDAAGLSGTELVPIVQDGLDVKTTVAAILGGAVAGWPIVSTTKEITWATSLANAVRIGDGSTPGCLFTDATNGFTITPCTASNVTTSIPVNFTWSLKDLELNDSSTGLMETVDPDAATTLLMWSYPSATYRPKKAVWFSASALSTDGTQCAAPAEVTINSGSKRWTILCADHDASTIYGEALMPNDWDGGTVTLTGSFIQTAADTNNLNADVAMACRADGDTINNTWGTEIAMDTALGGSNKTDIITTAAITPNGTCTGPDTLLQFRYQVDATGTTTGMTTLHHVGFKLDYSSKSRSSR